MKRFLIALAFVGLGTAANAQTTQIETPSKYCVATNSFWSNWYIQVGADMTLQNPSNVSDWADNVFHNGKTFGVDAAIGKWFTPGLGLRAKVQWENGIIEPHQHTFWAPDYDGGGYGAVYGDVQFNLSNMFCGYNENRVWNFIIYPRAGIVRNFSEKTYAPVLGAGVENFWKLGKVVGLYLDVAYSASTPHYRGYVCPQEAYDHGTHQGWLTAELGLQFNLGTSTWQKAVSLDAYNALAAASEEALAKLRAELDKERAENARLRAELAKKPTTITEPAKVEKVVAAAATSVFFDLNSTTINSKKDLINLEAVAAAAKETGAKVVVTGSADSQTGSSAWNQKLSEGRAQAAADELVRLGVNRDNIEVKAVGGINEVSPYVLNRRAVVELK